MKATVLRAGQLTVAEISAPPAPSAGQVIVEVLANGICGTDLHLTSDLDGWMEATERAGDTIKLFDRDHDVVLGHEFAGRVAELGAGVQGLTLGQLVYCMPIVFDNSGSMKCLGFANEYPGGLAQRATVQASACIPLPEGLNPATATFMDSMVVGEYAVVDRAKLHTGQAAVVIGTGPIGLGIIAALKRAGASPIIAVEPADLRRSAATALGADHVVNPITENWTDTWSELGITGPAFVFETSGVRGMIGRLFDQVPAGSTITSVASGTRDEAIRPSIGVKKDITLLFSMGGSLDAYTRMATELASLEPIMNPFVTTIGLDQTEAAFVALREPLKYIKIAVAPNS